jgi:hypothetical protein
MFDLLNQAVCAIYNERTLVPGAQTKDAQGVVGPAGRVRDGMTRRPLRFLQMISWRAEVVSALMVSQESGD